MKKITLAVVGIVLSAVACISCKETATPVGEGFEYIINIDDAETSETPVLISELCDKVITIIPETTDRSLLSGIHEVAHIDDRLYIFDRDFMRGPDGTVVMEFDFDGRFVRRFGNSGRGPGEYLGISDFAVNEMREELLLLDNRTQRILTYDRNSGRYLSEVSIQNGNERSHAITSVEDVLYTNLFYHSFDESNYMLRSWNISDPQNQSYYLHVAEYLKGWTNTNLISNSRFIYKGDRYSLFNDQFSNEIIKLTADGPSSYIYVNSEYFFGEKEREIMSEAYHVDDIGAPPDPNKNPNEILRNLDRWRGIDSYFETDKHIGFMMGGHGGLGFPMFLYDKGSEKVLKSYLKLDLIVKEEYPEAHSPFSFLQADEGGIFYMVRSEQIAELRTAAREGKLMDDLNNLEALKQLPDSANPVIFYLQFKQPL